MITTLPYVPQRVIAGKLKAWMLPTAFASLVITEESVLDVAMGRDGKIRARKRGEWTVHVVAPRELEVSIAERRLTEEGFDVERVGRLQLIVRGTRC